MSRRTHPSPSENAYAKPFGNYGIRQELLKEFSRKESEEKEEQASSLPRRNPPRRYLAKTGRKAFQS
ncbi:hypothetical protein MESMUL_22880 [Mesosutterella multiformis]|uniref:Uncharacterized protein n=1 Tax=Mesosutterella multiformis TaxID=2259133 RepID=A0A388SJK5_9BURK|nr:hypothetical protein MESMUL_22880 [Mesosutterella multiformis]